MSVPHHIICCATCHTRSYVKGLEVRSTRVSPIVGNELCVNSSNHMSCNATCVYFLGIEILCFVIESEHIQSNLHTAQIVIITYYLRFFHNKSVHTSQRIFFLANFLNAVCCCISVKSSKVRTAQSFRCYVCIVLCEHWNKNAGCSREVYERWTHFFTHFVHLQPCGLHDFGRFCKTFPKLIYYMPLECYDIVL